MYTMAIPEDLNTKVLAAAAYFWQTRNKQILRQSSVGVKDQGNRGAVTGGKQLDGFVKLIYELLVMNDIPKECIYVDADLELPGYYRPNKKWDLLVIDRGELVLAAEFKSQAGPSFGNNFNNRTEEAMGTALDLWTAYREGVFGTQKAPWLGYFMLLEDCPKSNEPVRTRSPHFHILEDFVNASYKERYEIFCSKLLLERQYNGACLVTTSCSEQRISCCSPKESLSFRTFVTSMLGAAMTHFAGRRC